jgi:hypothetical protein
MNENDFVLGANYKAIKGHREITGVSIDDMIERRWEKIGEIIVYCPHCGLIQKCRTIKTKRCMSCNRSFTIYPENKYSRIIQIPKGSKWILFELYNLVKHRRLTF